MKISTEITPDRQAIVTVEVDEDQMQDALKRAAHTISRVRPLPGFRPGKAPYEIVERTFGKEVLFDEAVEELSRSMYLKVLKDAEINAIDAGNVEVVQKEPPIFKYTIPVVPEVKLGDYHNIHMQPEEITVTDEEINEVLNRFQQTQATVTPVSRPVETGDVITVDVAGGVPELEQLDEKDMRVTVGDDGQARLPFDEQLLGMNAGETREVDYTYPEDAEDEEFRGKTAHYRVTVTDIKETQLPELTDEFAQAVSEFKSLDQFKGNIREIIRRQKQENSDTKFANQVLQAITDQSEIAFPPSMLDHEVEHDMEHLVHDIKRLGLEWDNYLRLSGKSEAQIKEQLRPSAEKRLKQLLVLTELIKAENIQVTREEVNADIERRVQETVAEGGNANAARRAYNQRDARENIEFNLRVSQVMNKIVAMAKGEATSGKILTPDMLRHQASPHPSGLITDPRQVRDEDLRGLELPK